MKKTFKERPDARQPVSSPEAPKDPLRERAERVTLLEMRSRVRVLAERDAVDRILQATNIDFFVLNVEGLIRDVEDAHTFTDTLTVEVVQNELEMFADLRNDLARRYTQLDELCKDLMKGIAARRALHLRKEEQREMEQRRAEEQSIKGRLRSFVASFAPDLLPTTKQTKREVELLVVKDENEEQFATLKERRDRIAALQRKIETAMGELRAWIRTQSR